MLPMQEGCNEYSVDVASSQLPHTFREKEETKELIKYYCDSHARNAPGRALARFLSSKFQKGVLSRNLDFWIKRSTRTVR
jgi:hypothetical protein